MSGDKMRMCDKPTTRASISAAEAVGECPAPEVDIYRDTPLRYDTN